MADVELRSVSYSFNGRIALEDVSFELDSPFFCAVMGPNGAGKTTLLKVMLGLLKPQRGSVRIFGHDAVREANAVRRLVGYVPQIVNVDIHVPMTVEEVVAMGALSRDLPPRFMTRDIRRRVEEVLKLVELDEPSALFQELSGGLRQRALIARALIGEPRLLLLDEPYSMLDFDMKCEISELLYRLHKERGVDILLVAHELSPCIHLEPIVVLLNKRVYAVGRAGEVLTIENLRKAYPGLTEVPAGFILGEDHG
ncbi:MAG: metal ABC transporter ATP-binding protein [Thaumarchaeota archaeon]|nr:MAG: metal ABC transporter ATP-binding protein [Nitrososphaerota archaeon]HDD66069.1 metal ABC transporter ATP-binding protein [Nitrososphaeria archaeon]